MEKISLNFVCGAIALLGGDKNLIDTVRSINEETNFENLHKMFELIDNKRYIIDKRDNRFELFKEECFKDNLTLDDSVEDSYTVVTQDKNEKIVTYHKSQQH